MTAARKTHVRCTMCGRWVRNDGCQAFCLVARRPDEARSFAESRRKSWPYCDACADTLARWMDWQRGRVPADWRDER